MQLAHPAERHRQLPHAELALMLSHELHHRGTGVCVVQESGNQGVGWGPAPSLLPPRLPVPAGLLRPRALWSALRRLPLAGSIPPRLPPPALRPEALLPALLLLLLAYLTACFTGLRLLRLWLRLLVLLRVLRVGVPCCSTAPCLACGGCHAVFRLAAAGGIAALGACLRCIPCCVL